MNVRCILPNNWFNHQVYYDLYGLLRLISSKIKPLTFIVLDVGVTYETPKALHNALALKLQPLDIATQSIMDGKIPFS